MTKNKVFPIPAERPRKWANLKPLELNVVIDKSEYAQRRAKRPILKCDDTSEVRLASKAKPFNHYSE